MAASTPILCVVVTTNEQVGNQIRSLRQASQIPAERLALALGVEGDALEEIESGQRAIRGLELAAVADLLGVSQLALLEPDSLLARLPLAPRPDAGLAEQAPPEVRRLVGLAELHQVLYEAGFRNEPTLGGTPDIEGLPWLDAANLLSAWVDNELHHLDGEDDPFSNLVDSVESRFGFDVMVEAVTGPLIGASITDASFPLILIAGDQPRPRALFTAAHELGHVLAGDGAPMMWETDLRAHDDRERFANAFAAALLMPEMRIREIMEEWGRGAVSIGKMLLRFGVSFESLTYRLHNLGIINANGRDQLRRIGWAGLFDALGEDREMVRTLMNARGSQPERRPPLFLTVRAVKGWLAGVIGPAPVAGLLGMTVEDLVRVAPSVGEGEPTPVEVIETDFSRPDEPEDVFAGFDVDPV